MALYRCGGGASTSDATANASDILAGKTAYNADGRVTGTMVNNGAISKTITPSSSTQAYTIPEGYHNGNGTVTVEHSSVTGSSFVSATANMTATISNVNLGSCIFIVTSGQNGSSGSTYTYNNYYYPLSFSGATIIGKGYVGSDTSNYRYFTYYVLQATSSTITATSIYSRTVTSTGKVTNYSVSFNYSIAKA